MTTARSSLVASVFLGLTLSLSACSKDKPEGTNPPEDGDAVADADGGKKGRKGKKGKKGKGGDGGDAGKDEPDWEKECPGEVFGTPTAMFPHPESGDPTGFIRVPKGMEKEDLVEQNPFFFMTMNQDGFQSTCEAMVAYMAAGIIDDDPAKDMKTFVSDFIGGQMGYKIEKVEEELSEGRKWAGSIEGSSQQGPAKLWVTMENKYNSGKVFFVILEAHPNAFNAIKPTFKASTDSLIVVPPDPPAEG